MLSTSRSSARPEYRFFRHREYGLLREAVGRAQFDIFHDDGTWQGIILNPFVESMAPITDVRATELAGGRDLRAPVVAREVSPGVVEPVQ